VFGHVQNTGAAHSRPARQIDAPLTLKEACYWGDRGLKGNFVAL